LLPASLAGYINPFDNKAGPFAFRQTGIASVCFPTSHQTNVMTFSRITAIVQLLIGIFLAVIAFIALTMGEGYLRLVGGIAAAGAVLLLFFAAGHYFRKPASRDDASGLPHGLFRRLIFLAIAIYALGVPLYAVAVSGKIPVLSIDSRRMISLKAEPQSFWLMAGLHAVPGLYCLFLGMRRRK